MANTLQRIVAAVVLLIGILFFYPLSRWLVPYDIGVRAVPYFGYALLLMLFYTYALGRGCSGSGLKFSGKALVKRLPLWIAGEMILLQIALLWFFFCYGYFITAGGILLPVLLIVYTLIEAALLLVAVIRGITAAVKGKSCPKEA